MEPVKLEANGAGAAPSALVNGAAAGDVKAAAAAPAAAGAPAAAAPAPTGALSAATGGGTKDGTDGGRPARKCVASVCLLRLSSGGDASELCSVEVAPCLRLAACGRADGAIDVCRFSRDTLLESRFHAPHAASPPMVVRSLYGHSGPVYSTSASRDSKFLLSAGQDGGVRLWSLRHGCCLMSYREHGCPVFHTAFSPHNSHFLTGGYDGALRIFTTERRAPLRVLAGHHGDINHAIFHPNGAYALSGSHDGTLRLWDVATASCIRLFHGHTAPVRAVAISHDGTTAASASEDSTVRLWHLASGRELKKLPAKGDPGACAVSFSHSGRLLASAGRHNVFVWEVRDLMQTKEEEVAPALSLPSPVPLINATFVPGQTMLIASGAEDAPKAGLWAEDGAR